MLVPRNLQRCGGALFVTIGVGQGRESRVICISICVFYSFFAFLQTRKWCFYPLLYLGKDRDRSQSQWLSISSFMRSTGKCQHFSHKTSTCCTRRVKVIQIRRCDRRRGNVCFAKYIPRIRCVILAIILQSP
jgi:hypothetical protein